MNATANAPGGVDLAIKIARLVEERGWNQEDFTRISQLNRHTIRQILRSGGPNRRLRNATVLQCAKALGLTVGELRNQPLDRLIPRMNGKPPPDDEALKLLYDRAALPGLVSWLDRNRDRAGGLAPAEIQELLEMQGAGGPMEKLGAEYCVGIIERRRELMRLVREISGTEYLCLLEQLVKLIHEKVQPAKKQ